MKRTNNKIIITGAGRAGTTFLIQMFTRLGFDTGFEPYKEHSRKDLRAGCEFNVDVTGTKKDLFNYFDKKVPTIIKAPLFSLVLKKMIDDGFIKIGHVFIPVRDLQQSAESRLDVGLQWISNNNTVEQQAEAHALVLGTVIEACVTKDIPFTLMKFPDIVKDANYCYKKMSEGVKEKIDRRKFNEVFKKTAKPRMIKFK